MHNFLYALVVEDSEPDYALLVDTLSRQAIDIVCERVDTESGMRAALRRRTWDLVVSDHHLPGFSSMGALSTLREFDSFTPFLIVSGTIGEEVAVAAMHAGADDYLLKGNLARLGAAVRRAIDSAKVRREREKVQTALAESRRQLQALSAHLQSSIEAERRSIARELHDDVGSALTALKFDLDWLSRLKEPGVTERCVQAVQMLNQTQLACQRIMRNLRPPILEAGLAPALQWLGTQFRQRHKIQLDLRFNRDLLALSDDAALTVFRTVQEALTNIGKHSNATRASIDVVQSDESLSVEISDNGIGIKEDDLAKAASFGLRGLRERALAVNGWLEVSISPSGTALLLILGRVDGEK